MLPALIIKSEIFQHSQLNIRAKDKNRNCGFHGLQNFSYLTVLLNCNKDECIQDVIYSATERDRKIELSTIYLFKGCRALYNYHKHSLNYSCTEV